MVETMKIPPTNIIIFGRSIGTGPSTYLASERKVTALVLISPMLSIQNVFKDILGSLVSMFVNDKFENYKRIEKVKCPVLIIHGQNDTLIKFYHSTELYNRVKAPCELILPENMDHNEFDFYQEFSEPLLDFISRNGVFANTQPSSNVFNSDLYKTPESFKMPLKNWNIITNILKKLSFK
jgi:fermentation-respiration switch protein FrsA (DUF1100 family)